MSAMDIFNTVGLQEKLDFVVEFLKRDRSFCDFVEMRYGDLKFKVGDLCWYRTSDTDRGYIVKVVSVSKDYYDLISCYGNSITSNYVSFPPEEYKRDWEENFISRVKAEFLFDVPSFVYKHFYHDTFENGNMKKGISTLVDFEELEIDHCRKIIKIPFHVKDEDDQKNKNPEMRFEDIGIKSTEYETVFEEKQAAKLA